MSIATEIQRLQQAKADIAEAIVAKGGEVSGTIDTYASAIEALPSGGDSLADYINNTLTEYVVPEGVTSLRTYCFYGSSDLVHITLPESLTNIGGYCFQNCTKLTDLVLPQNITGAISIQAFSGCTGLTKIVIPNKVTSLANMAFYGCTNMMLYDFGTGLTSVGSNAFGIKKGCVYIFRSINPPNVPTNGFSGNLSAIYVPDESINTYKSASNFNTYASIIHPLSEYQG